MTNNKRPRIRVFKVDNLYVQRDTMLPALTDYLSIFCNDDDQVVLVHGGDSEILSWSRRLYGANGDGVQESSGKRLAMMSEPNMNMAIMVQCGIINKRLVAALEQSGQRALGLSGVDGSLATTSLLNARQLGLVGGPPKVDGTMLEKLLALNVVLVLAPICLDRQGRIVYVDADTMAQSVAVALNADVLEFIADVSDKHNENGFVACMSHQGVDVLNANSLAGMGMPTKLQASLAALDGGVSRVWVGDLESLQAHFTNGHRTTATAF